MRAWCLLFSLLAVPVVFGQDASAAPELNAAEKQFQESLNNVTLVGSFTSGDTTDLHEDRYVIERISKVKDDTWKFDAHIQFNKKDFKIAISLPVKFAGDTPMISLTHYAVPGFGSFSARIVFYDGAYVGTWSSNPEHKGIMFGKIVKNASPQ